MRAELLIVPLLVIILFGDHSKGYATSGAPHMKTRSYFFRSYNGNSYFFRGYAGIFWS